MNCHYCGEGLSKGDCSVSRRVGSDIDGEGKMLLKEIVYLDYVCPRCGTFSSQKEGGLFSTEEDIYEFEESLERLSEQLGGSRLNRTH